MPNEMVDAIFKSVEDYLARSLKAFDEKIDARFAALPVPKDGRDADPVMVASLVKEAAAAMLPAIVEQAAAKIPIPKNGDAGLDAYQLAVAEGFVGTKAEWLASLVGKQGEPGQDATITSTSELGDDEFLARIDGSIGKKNGTISFADSGFGALFSGGTTPVGRFSIVGERGPELMPKNTAQKSD